MKYLVDEMAWGRIEIRLLEHGLVARIDTSEPGDLSAHLTRAQADEFAFSTLPELKAWLDKTIFSAEQIAKTGYVPTRQNEIPEKVATLTEADG